MPIVVEIVTYFSLLIVRGGRSTELKLFKTQLKVRNRREIIFLFVFLSNMFALTALRKETENIFVMSSITC